jgi:hypothetical protein
MKLLWRPLSAVPAGSNRGKRDHSETRWQNAGPVWTLDKVFTNCG